MDVICGDLELMDNKSLYNLFLKGDIEESELKCIFRDRIKVFTRVNVGNINLRIDLISKQNEGDKNYFMALNKICTYNELSEMSIKLGENVTWEQV
ncbi:hypothetical protein H9L25_00310 [Terrisporobacter mayombei]|nr:hypothetical protein [Terrisporobacter mayombei]